MGKSGSSSSSSSSSDYTGSEKVRKLHEKERRDRNKHREDAAGQWQDEVPDWVGNNDVLGLGWKGIQSVSKWVSETGVIEDAADMMNKGQEQLLRFVNSVKGDETGAAVQGKANENANKAMGFVKTHGNFLMNKGKDIVENSFIKVRPAAPAALALLSEQCNKLIAKSPQTVQDVFVVGENGADEMLAHLGKFKLPESDLRLIDDKYNMTDQEIHHQEKVVEGIIINQLRLVKFDIVRDFFQILSLFITTLEFPKVFKDFWGVIATFISIEIEFIIPNSALLFFWLTTFISWSLMLWLIFLATGKPDLERQGEEAGSWKTFSKWKRRGIQLNITILLTLYLPVTRNSLQLFVCELQPWVTARAEKTTDAYGLLYTTYPEEFCYTFAHILHILVGVANILILTILLPIKVYLIIQKHRPLSNKGGHFEADGTFAEKYTKEQYYDALTRDLSPYRFLYDGLELEWSHYKVVAMVVKIILIVPVVVARDRPSIQAGIALGVLTTVFAFSMYSAPFIKNEDDRIDSFARFTTAVTVGGGLFTSLYKGSKSHLDYVGWTLNAINVVNIIVIIFLTLASLGSVKRKWKSFTGRVDWDEKLLRGGDNVRWYKVERLHRVWQRFWNTLILFDEALDDVQYRLAAQKKVASQVGPSGYRSGLTPPAPNIAQARKYAQTNLEGLDVYWNGPVAEPDGTLVANKSKSHFGKMYVTPFPFRCNIVYDDVREIAVIDDTHIVKLVEMNNDPAVVKMRQNRHALRALSGQKVCFDHTFGSSQGRIAKLTVIQEHVTDIWSPGFRVVLKYSRNRVLDSNDYVDDPEGGPLGIRPDCAMTPNLHRLLLGNRTLVEERIPIILAEEAHYRRSLLEKRRKEINDIAWSFWYVVFNNDAMKREELENYLTKFEKCAQIKNIPKDHAIGLDLVYARLAMFATLPTSAWFIFWDEFWELNNTLSKVQKNSDLFSPSQLTCIVYHPMPKNTLIDILKRKKLKNLVSKERINDLYRMMEDAIRLKSINNSMVLAKKETERRASIASPPRLGERRMSVESSDASDLTSRTSETEENSDIDSTTELSEFTQDF